MCGRFVLESAFDIIAKVFNLVPANVNIPTSYNITPGRDIAIIVNDGGVNRLTTCRWGFVPPWARELNEGYKMINARAETVADKPSFRQGFRRHRCLIVADGFYEWKHEGGKKTPVYVRLRSGRPFGMAGLFSLWTPPEGGEQVCTGTIITADANQLVAPYHDRMPVITPADKVGLWLDPAVQETEKLLPVLRPYPDDELELYEVTAKVNSPKNDGPENIERISRQ